MHTSTTLTRRLRLAGAIACLAATAACNSGFKSGAEASATSGSSGTAAKTTATTATKDVADPCALVTNDELTALGFRGEIEIQDKSNGDSKGCLRIAGTESGSTDHLRVAVNRPGILGGGDDDFDKEATQVPGLGDGATAQCRPKVDSCLLLVHVGGRTAVVDWYGGDSDLDAGLKVMTGIAQHLVDAMKG